MESTVTPASVVHRSQVSYITFPPHQYSLVSTAWPTEQNFTIHLFFISTHHVCYVKTGKHCEVEQVPCASHPCESGGVCRPSADYTSYTCRCPAGWQGMCVSDLKSYLLLCWGHANIRLFVYNCLGMRCTEDVNECKKNPCKNGGNCINSQGSYRCICRPGYSGHNCQIDIDDCSPSESHFDKFSPCTANDSCTSVFMMPMWYLM